MRKNKSFCITSNNFNLTHHNAQLKRVQKTSRKGKIHSKRRREIIEENEYWNWKIKKQLEAKRFKDKRANDIREEEIALARDKWEEEKKNRKATREHNAKQIEFMHAVINNMKW